jgi:phosphoribosyl 1,2-cyclic phosphodiesterase
MSFTVKFWGIRGGVAVSSPDYVGYGGNTSCVEIMLDGHYLVFDAGTGIRLLGQKFLRENIFEIELFLSHTQWDYTDGFPFFVPAYDPRHKIRVFAGHLKCGGGVKETLAKQMKGPVFPVPIETMRAEIKFEDFTSGDTIEITPEIMVRTAPLNHPSGGTGFRVDYHGKSVCYLPGTEHTPGEISKIFVKFCEGSNLLIYDCSFTEGEFESKKGWGHSTWNQGVLLAKAAHVNKLILYQHSSEHNDEFIREIEVDAQREFANAISAKEGMEIAIE